MSLRSSLKEYEYGRYYLLELEIEEELRNLEDHLDKKLSSNLKYALKKYGIWRSGMYAYIVDTIDECLPSEEGDWNDCQTALTYCVVYKNEQYYSHAYAAYKAHKDGTGVLQYMDIYVPKDLIDAIDQAGKRYKR
ncbi:MAG: hypothetical protein QXQ33_00705 [Nitrososphaerota archaeon]